MIRIAVRGKPRQNGSQRPAGDGKKNVRSANAAHDLSNDSDGAGTLIAVDACAAG